VNIDLVPTLKGHNTFDISCLVLKSMDTNMTLYSNSWKFRTWHDRYTTIN